MTSSPGLFHRKVNGFLKGYMWVKILFRKRNLWYPERIYTDDITRFQPPDTAHQSFLEQRNAQSNRRARLRSLRQRIY